MRALPVLLLAIVSSPLRAEYQPLDPAAAPPASGAETPLIEPPPTGSSLLFATPRYGHAAVKAAPHRGAATLGDVRTAVPVEESPAQRRGARGCTAWLLVQPRGYLCRDDVHLTRAAAPPSPPEPDAPPTNYRYGVVHAAETALREAPAAAATVARLLHRGDGVTVTGGAGAFYRTSSHHYIARADVRVGTPPPPLGRDLRELPRAQRHAFAWLVPDAGRDEVPVLGPAQVASTGAVSPTEARLVPRYTTALVLGPAALGPAAAPARGPTAQPGAPIPGGTARGSARAADLAAGADPVTVLLLDGSSRRGTVAARHLRRVLRATPPPDLRPGERWIDISLSQQVATAYAGDEALFAAVVSTGKAGGTPEGTFSIYRKYLTQTMANSAGARSYYDFRKVPHAQFFHGGIGLHAALWHDQLGYPISHGCVNLSQSDAARFFAFTDPPLPPGWHEVSGSAADAPQNEEAGAPKGTRVVVHR